MPDPDLDTRLDALLGLHHQYSTARDVLAKDQLAHFDPLRLIDERIGALADAIKALFAPAPAGDGESS